VPVVLDKGFSNVMKNIPNISAYLTLNHNTILKEFRYSRYNLFLIRRIMSVESQLLKYLWRSSQKLFNSELIVTQMGIAYMLYIRLTWLTQIILLAVAEIMILIPKQVKEPYFPLMVFTTQKQMIPLICFRLLDSKSYSGLPHQPLLHKDPL